MAKSKLKLALAAEKGTDFRKLKDKKKHKQALKAKTKKVPTTEDDEEDEEADDVSTNGANRNGLIGKEQSESEDEDEDEDEETYLTAAMDDSEESDSEVEMEEKIERTSDKKSKTEMVGKNLTKGKEANGKGGHDEDNEDEEDEEEEDEEKELAWSDVDEEDRAGLAVHQRQTINNTAALTAALARIRAFATAGSGTATAVPIPFHLHLSVTSDTPTAAAIPDVQDDVVRELQLYRQSRDAAVVARAALRREKVPFTRPTDYFAEMVKDDGHMGQVRARLVEAATAKKAAAEARKQRDLKKFGKQVQVARLQERAKQKKETLEKIKSLKRKRQESGATTTHEADMFDVAVDHELATPSGGGKRKSGPRSGGPPQPNAKRQKKNDKYGFGGKKRHSKSGDALSSGDVSGFDAKRMKSRPDGKAGKGFKAARPGKARRKAAAGRR